MFVSVLLTVYSVFLFPLCALLKSLVLVVFVKAAHVSASHKTSLCKIHAYHRMFDGFTLYEVFKLFQRQVLQS